MKKYSFTNNGFTFERINKKDARTAYINGLSVVICPANLRPFTGFHPEMTINRRNREQFVIDEIGVKNDFENYINSFEFYNCRNSETGRYTAFYIPVRYVDRFTGETPTAATMGTCKEYDYNYMER